MKQFYIAHFKAPNAWGWRVSYRMLVAAKDDEQAGRIARAGLDKKVKVTLNPLNDECKIGVLMTQCIDSTTL